MACNRLKRCRKKKLGCESWKECKKIENEKKDIYLQEGGLKNKKVLPNPKMLALKLNPNFHGRIWWL